MTHSRTSKGPVEIPDAVVKRLASFDKTEYMTTDVNAVGMDRCDSGMYIAKHMYKNNWAIVQLFTNNGYPFPMTAESALVRLAVSKGRVFYLDWTGEAQSWFMAIDYSDSPFAQTKHALADFAQHAMRLLSEEALPPEAYCRDYALRATRSWKAARFNRTKVLAANRAEQTSRQAQVQALM